MAMPCFVFSSNLDHVVGELEALVGVPFVASLHHHACEDL